MNFLLKKPAEMFLTFNKTKPAYAEIACFLLSNKNIKLGLSDLKLITKDDLILTEKTLICKFLTSKFNKSLYHSFDSETKQKIDNLLTLCRTKNSDLLLQKVTELNGFPLFEKLSIADLIVWDYFQSLKNPICSEFLLKIEKNHPELLKVQEKVTNLLKTKNIHFDYKNSVIFEISRITNIPFENIKKLVVVPLDEKNGHFSIPVAALRIKGNVAKTTTELQEKVIPNEYIQSAKAVGNYLNFYINGEKLIKEIVPQILSLDNEFGSACEGLFLFIIKIWKNLSFGF